MSRRIGTHIRLTDTFTNVLEKALRLEIPFFQTFLSIQNGKHIRPEYEDVKNFLNLRRKYFKDLYIHASYWINLCLPESGSYYILEKEILMAKKLEFTHLVLHPGAASGCKDKFEGIDFLAKRLNRILRLENDISIILENTAHGNLSIGGDFNDFNFLLKKLDYPEKISFCIDTAHAYSFGYDLSDENKQDNFFEMIQKDIGKDKISLIHLNDTLELLGSKIDKHSIPGQGNIGQKALQRFIEHHHLDQIPIIVELPNLPEEQEKNIIDNIKSWI